MITRWQHSRKVCLYMDMRSPEKILLLNERIFFTKKCQRLNLRYIKGFNLTLEFDIEKIVYEDIIRNVLPKQMKW